MPIVARVFKFIKTDPSPSILITFLSIANDKPKPIDDAKLLDEIISNIKNINSIYRKESLDLLIYNVLPGTTSAARVKAKFLKDIILGCISLDEIMPDFAFELLSHMKGGPSVEVLIDLALGDDQHIAKEAAKILKTQVFLYEDDMDRLEEAYKNKNDIAEEIIVSYSNAEFFTKLPEVAEEIKGQGKLFHKKNLL